MIKIENVSVTGWEASIRGLRNPMNSWDRSDSEWVGGNVCDSKFVIGENDLNLMRRLARAGAVHGKYLRMITVTMDITCHHVWWAEFDTYKVGTVRNSCSKMHKIHVKSFERDDFSHEGIDEVGHIEFEPVTETFNRVLETLEWLRQRFNETQEKKYWRAMIELLPMGYNIKATVLLNYEVLRGIYEYRKEHKVEEWRTFCREIEKLPYFKQIFLE